MSAGYKAVQWNRSKRVYDFTLAAGIAVYLGLFIGLGAVWHPNATAETLIIRGFGTAALSLLHITLAIGPLCRLDARFLPLLYNRRHLGVITFLLGLIHGAFATVQFHVFGDVNPLVSLLTSNTQWTSAAEFPFQQLGAAALTILFVMAATSHDFWLHNLTPRVWKSIHMLVYAAYALLVAHVTFGALQSETHPALAFTLAAGAAALVILHLAAARKERRADAAKRAAAGDGFVKVCSVHQIPEGRAVITACAGCERIAVFKYNGKISALSNVCRHQNGPLGEGRIVDGCVTCPWHGYQYDPGTGVSPPPFDDVVETYATRVIGGVVLVNPIARSKQ